MAPDARATGDIASVVGNYYDKLMLERLVDRALIYKLADKKSMPKGTGTTINWNRYTNFPVPRTAISEGEVPTIKYLSGTAVTATLFQLGDYCAISDVLELTSFSNVVKEAVSNFGDSAATAVDEWILSKLMSEHATDNPMNMLNGDDVTLTTWFGAKQGGISSVFVSASGLIFTAYAGALWNHMSVTGNCTADIGGGYAADLNQIAVLAGKLKENNCLPFSDGYYKMVMHAKQATQIKRTDEWARWHQYTRPEAFDKGEIGRAHGVRIYDSNVVLNFHTDVLSQYTNLCNYFAPIWGQGAFAVTELTTKKGVETFVKAPNKYDTSNPLNQWSTIGWKVLMAAQSLNDNCGYFLMTLG